MGQYIGFNLGKEEYVIPILMVQEIMKPSQTTKLPHSSEYIMGIINLRGKTIAVIDLKQRLGLVDSGSPGDGNIIVVNIGKITFGAKVDAITGVMNIEEDMIKTDLDLAGGAADTALLGVANLDENRMVLIIDFSRLLSISDMSLLGDDITSTEETGDGKMVVTRKISSMGGDVFVKEVRDALEKSATGKGMESDIVSSLMDDVQKLIDSFSSGDIEGAERAVEKLSSYGEREIFSEVGKMTRKLHDSLNDFKQLIDPRLKTMAQNEMPEAADKLEWVITRTDEAASKTITLAEKNQARISQLQLTIDLVEERLASSGSPSAVDKELTDMLRSVLGEMDNDFLEMMLAQEFQDLTGQILKKVIRLVSELEEQLVTLVKVFGVKVESKKVTQADEEKAVDLPGPQIKEGEGILSGQGDVDSLLAEFGF